jgi:hypothetical protein
MGECGVEYCDGRGYGEPRSRVKTLRMRPCGCDVIVTISQSQKPQRQLLQYHSHRSHIANCYNITLAEATTPCSSLKPAQSNTRRERRRRVCKYPLESSTCASCYINTMREGGEVHARLHAVILDCSGRHEEHARHATGHVTSSRTCTSSKFSWRKGPNFQSGRANLKSKAVIHSCAKGSRSS